MRSGLHFIGGQQAAISTDPLKGRVTITVKREGGSITVEVDPHGPEAEAEHALQNALNALKIAGEKCAAADYGSLVILSLQEAGDHLLYAQRVIRGEV